MTREEAVNLLNNSKPKGNNAYSIMLNVALDMAIKSLEQEPCEDAISRQAVLDGLASIAKAKAKSDAQKSLMGRVMFFVEQTPSVQPKTGHWILTDDDFVYCSECEDSYYPRPIDASWNYCPHCGARMESEESE